MRGQQILQLKGIPDFVFCQVWQVQGERAIKVDLRWVQVESFAPLGRAK